MYTVSLIKDTDATAAQIAALEAFAAAGYEEARNARADADYHREVRAALAAEIENLRNQLAASRARHREDIAIIGEELMAQAEYHGWCSQYDEVIDKLNTQLTVELPERQREYRVRLIVYVDVTARDAQGAGDAAVYELSGYDDIYVDDVDQL